MIIRIKQGNKYINVHVSSINCSKYTCFSPHKYQHKNKTIDRKSNNWQDNYFSCSHRNYHGCPDKPKLKEN